MLPNSLSNQFKTLRAQGKKITLVTGVFDLLHQEHLLFLQKARLIGDVLVVGLESDLRVQQMKGEGRPIENQSQRLENVEKIPGVDFAFILPTDFSQPAHHDQLIGEIQPAFLAISSHTAHQAEKEKIMAKYGGKVVVVHQHNPELSTSQILRTGQ